MKREIFKVHRLSARYSNAVSIDEISLSFMGGESTGLLGLTNSGKSLFVRVICGDSPAYQGRAYLDGRQIDLAQKDKHPIYKITASNYQIDDWTVAEYIGLLMDRASNGIYHQRKLNDRIDERLKELGFSLDVSLKLGELSEVKKRIADLAKAYLSGARVIIIEDEFSGCTEKDIRTFRRMMDLICSSEIAFIINSNSNNVYSILSDHYVILRSGTVVKKCKADVITELSALDPFLMEQRTISSKEYLDRYHAVAEQEKEILYTVEHVILQSGNIMQFDFAKGEVTGILCRNIKEKERIFHLLSGRLIEKQMTYYLDGERKDYKNVNDLVEDKIAAIDHVGNIDELLPWMTAGENLLMPSLGKLSTWQYMISDSRIRKMLAKEIHIPVEDLNKRVADFGTNEYISLLLERWYVFRPRILLMFEPFLHCDVYGVSLVKSYIHKFTQIGTAVIIVKSREEYLEDIVTRMIRIDD